VNASHVATGGITALLATVLVYISHWPLQPLDVPTASAFAGLLVAAGGGLVRLYRSRIASTAQPVSREVNIAPAASPSAGHEPRIAA
jgi:hypothetical protein